MVMSKVRELKKGDYFILHYKENPIDAADVWIKDSYLRSEKKYLCVRASDLMTFEHFDPYLSVILVEPVR